MFLEAEITSVCLGCGESFSYRKSYIVKYCSDVCRVNNRVLKRKDWECVDCGVQGRVVPSFVGKRCRDCNIRLRERRKELRESVYSDYRSGMKPRELVIKYDIKNSYVREAVRIGDWKRYREERLNA